MKRANQSLLKCLLLGVLTAATLSSTANAWWNDEWTLRKKITIDTSDKGAPIADAIGTTPVLVRLHDGVFQFAAAKEDGGDIRFVAADDKTVLKYHIEKFDSLMAESFVWVSVPDVKPGVPTSFWLYYGSSANKAVKADDAKGTYDADTVLVYHFAGHSAPASDYSAAGNNAQNAGLGSDGSMIGGGLRLDGHTAVTIPASPSLAFTEGASMTWSAWVKFGAAKPDGVIFSRRDGANGLVIGANNGVPYVEVKNAAGTQRSSAGAAVVAGSWHHVAVVASGAKIVLYLDGESYGTLNAALPALNSVSIIGGDSSAATADAPVGESGLLGELDELEISKVARSAGFIKLAAISQSGDKGAKLVALGDDEQPTNWFSWLTTGTFGVILKSLTLDGWVVIGVLAVMSVISWFVMIGKTKYLNGIAKGNKIFMKAWSHVASDLTVLDHGDSEKAKTLGGQLDKVGQKLMRDASVYRIYHIGSEEIRHRLANGKSKQLSSLSVQAIRASLDGGVVRETQRLNNMLVVLTIAISGGPFLGLLGTVIGVMITFAAIAAAGDVNVNAIAPGIAAALVATVAGLLVAIPALFGYNYLTIRIKDATSDMHVFIDEFITKIAEFYGQPE